MAVSTMKLSFPNAVRGVPGKQGVAQIVTVASIQSAFNDATLMTQIDQFFQTNDFSWAAFTGPESVSMVHNKLLGASLASVVNLAYIMIVRGNKLWKYMKDQNISAKLNAMIDLNLLINVKNAGTDKFKKNRPQVVLKAFPFITRRVRRLIADKGIPLFEPKGHDDLPVEYKWGESICYFPECINEQGKIVLSLFIPLVFNYIQWQTAFIDMRSLEPGKDSPAKIWNRLQNLSWLGRVLESYDIATQMSWAEGKATTAKTGSFNEKQKSMISAAVGYNLWAMVPALTQKTVIDEKMLNDISTKVVVPMLSENVWQGKLLN